MAYKKHIWEDGVTIINAERMNHIEAGLEEVSEKASDEKSYKLIRSIIVDEESNVRQFDFTDLDIDNYWVRFEVAAGTANVSCAMTTYVLDTTQKSCAYAWLGNMVVADKPVTCDAFGEIRNGVAFCRDRTPTADSSITSTNVREVCTPLVSVSAKFDRIYGYLGTGAYFPVGSKIELYTIPRE